MNAPGGGLGGLLGDVTVGQWPGGAIDADLAAAANKSDKDLHFGTAQSVTVGGESGRCITFTGTSFESAQTGELIEVVHGGHLAKIRVEIDTPKFAAAKAALDAIVGSWKWK